LLYDTVFSLHTQLLCVCVSDYPCEPVPEEIFFTGWPVAWNWRRAVLSADAGLLVTFLVPVYPGCPGKEALSGCFLVMEKIHHA